MRHSYDQSEFTQPGAEFNLPPEQSATLSGGRRFADRFGLRGRTLAEPDETERQAAEVLAEEGPAEVTASEELTPSEASSASADTAQTAAKKEKRRRSLLLQFAAAASSVVLVTNSFGIDFLGMDGLFNDSVILGEVSHEHEPSHHEPEPEVLYGDFMPFGGDRTLPRLDNEALWTVTQARTVDANNKYVAEVDFIDGSMGEQAMVESLVWYGRKEAKFLTAPIPMSVPENVSSPNSSSIRYDADTNTLTLRDYHGKGLLVNNMGQDFTIRLEGDNVLDQYLMVACGSVTITGEGGIFINEDKDHDYGIHVVGQWSNAHLVLDGLIKFNISGRKNIFRISATCSEKPVWYKSYSVWETVFQGKMLDEDVSVVKDDPEHYYSWMMFGENQHSTVVSINNGYEPGGSVSEPSSEAPAPVTIVRVPVGGDSAFPMLPNPMPDSVGADGRTHASEILVWEDYASNGDLTGPLTLYSNQQNHPTGRDDISYDPASNTLTLNNYSGGRLDVRSMGSSFKIRLVGKNELFAGIQLFGDLTSGSVTFTGDGYLALNSPQRALFGIYLDAGNAAACIMFDSSVTMDIYGSNEAVIVYNTSADKGIYYLSDAVPDLMQARDGGEGAPSVPGTFYDWKTVTGQGGSAKHIHLGGEVPPDPLPTEPQAENGLPVGGDLAFPVLPNPDPNTPTPHYGVLDEDYIQIYDHDLGSAAMLYLNEKWTDTRVAPQGISYDRSTNTLTLNNYHGEWISANLLGNAFTVEVIGDNVLNGRFEIWGFYTGGSVRFTGPGSLTINALQRDTVGLILESEFSETCVMIDDSVTLDIYGGTSAVMVKDTRAEKGIYLISPAPRPGVRQNVYSQNMPDIDSVPQVLHNTWVITGSDDTKPLTRFRVEGSGWISR